MRSVVMRRMTSTTYRLSTWAHKTGRSPLMYLSPFVSAVAARDGLPSKQRSLRCDVLPRTDCCHVLLASAVAFLSDS